jgi:hypothetical protein
MAKKKTKARKTAAKTAAKTTKKARTRSARRRAAAPVSRVTMTIALGAGAPGDVMTIRRIDNQALATPSTDVGPGAHTAGWDVISPTVRPIGFDVTITDDASGRSLLNRPGQRTGDDGRGAGAGTFRV